MLLSADLDRMTLNEVDAAYQAGRVDGEALRLWLEKWNSTPCRFSHAYVSGGSIRTRLKEDK